MKGFARILPHPALSTLVFVGWLLIARSLEPGHVLLAAFLAFALPLFTRRFWPETVRLYRPFTMVRFLAVVLWDIVVANFSVALVVLGPKRSVQPGFVRFELALDNDFAITMLASTISLTPGTVSSELCPERRYLTVHYLSCDDEAELIETIRKRYESPIGEIFGC